ncbi:50S ribosomal protein L37ae [Candidatus Woesearchaeota archaeon]|nr:50S ribosomal protein L37ae [Candidatus Woesearchaeota archaeon]
MAKTERYGSVKRFGARYGRKLKEKFGKIEAEQRKKHKCPYCSAPKVKRIAAGIWGCRKCGVKFTGKAYSIAKKAYASSEAPISGKKEAIEAPEKENDNISDLKDSPEETKKVNPDG